MMLFLESGVFTKDKLTLQLHHVYINYTFLLYLTTYFHKIYMISIIFEMFIPSFPQLQLELVDGFTSLQWSTVLTRKALER